MGPEKKRQVYNEGSVGPRGDGDKKSWGESEGRKKNTVQIST